MLTPNSTGSHKRRDGAELDSIRDELQDIRKTLDIVAKDNNELKAIIRGNTGLGLRGLMARIDNAEKMLDTIETERQRQETLIKGIGIGLGLTSLTGVGTLVVTLLEAFSAAP